jgi:translation initiation factor 5B
MNSLARSVLKRIKLLLFLYKKFIKFYPYFLFKISRESIDAVKNYFREEMTKNDWQLIIELKRLFQIL